MRARSALGALGALVLAILSTMSAGCSGDGGDFVLTPPAQTATPRNVLLGGTIQGIALSLTDTVTTFAGTAGAAGGDDGTGAAARFAEPYGITTDGTRLYVSEKSGDRIRTLEIATGAVTTLVPAGTLREPVGITNDGTFAYVCDSQSNAIQRVTLADGTLLLVAGGTQGSADGTGAAAQFNDPYGITVVGGNLFVADRRNHTIRQIVADTGVVTTLAGSPGVAGAVDGTGATARFNEPMSITTDGTFLYVGDWGSFLIRKVEIATGTVTTLAGTAGTTGAADGVGLAATFYGPRGLTTDGAFLYVADFYNRHGGVPIPVPEPALESSLIRRVALSTGEVVTIAGTPDTFGSSDGVGAVARFRQPCGVTGDGTSLFVTDRMNHTVRQIQ